MISDGQRSNSNTASLMKMSSNIQLSTENINFPHQENGYAHKCFPVRNIRRFKPDDGGAWLVEYKAEKERQIETLNRTTNIPKKKSEKAPKNIQELTGFLLTKEFHLEEPSALFSININGRQLYSVKDEDFSLFGNVLYIEAGDNRLDFETFKSFPRLEELHLQVNWISAINITHKDFPSLKRLDLSYNCLKDHALLNLGKLRNIKELTLRGCGLKNLHAELARAYLVCTADDDEAKSTAEKKSRFLELEHLDLSENKLTDLSTFASLAGLRKLKTLNLSSNKICGVPHLRLLVSHRHLSASTSCYCKTSNTKLPPDVNSVLEETSMKNITKAKEFCEVKNSLEAVVVPSIEVCGDTNNIAQVSGAGDKNIAQIECEGVSIISEVEDKIFVEVTEKPCESDLPERGFVPDSRKGSVTDNAVDVSDSEVNMEDSIDMADDINFDISFDGEIDEKLLKEVNDDNQKIHLQNEPKESCKELSTVEDLIDMNGIENVDVETMETDSASILNPKVLLAFDNTVETNNLNAGFAENLVIGDESHNTLDAEDIKFKNIKEKELLSTDLAQEINFTLGKAFNEDIQYVSNDSCNYNEDVKTSADDVINNLKSPFPSLKMLDLSTNLISEEAALLALTSWPVLQDLKLWENPLMQSFKGLPPIISHHLHAMCGINVHGKPPQTHHHHPIAPSICKSAKTYRVKNNLPRIKRNNILMIEAEIQKAIEDKDESSKKALPPVDVAEKDDDNIEMKKSNEREDIDEDGEGIFITQVNEDEVEEPEQNTAPKQLPEDNGLIDSKYAGYEELLKIDETYEPESDIRIPSTVYGSVQALRLMLKNPLVFKEGNYNKKSRLNHNYGDKKKKSAPPQVEKRNDKIADALEIIRTKGTTSQENLATVLNEFNTSSGMKEKFPDAKKITKRVQEKYDKVRLESLRPISVAQAELSSMSTRADKHSQDLILMRMKQGRIGDLYSSPRSTTFPRSRAASSRKTAHTAP